MKPSWSTNILDARNVWEAMERPRNLKEPSPTGTLLNTRRKADDKANLVKFKVMKLDRLDLNM